jgi:predicted DsbA family dithiol-disulfide isomerase
MPVEGVAKPPNTPENPRAGARMKAAGAAVGIDFTGLTDRYPNTLLAHCLLKYAEGDPAAQDRLSEILFRHYFTDGLFPDAANLRAAAAEAGLADVDAALEWIETPENQSVVKAEGVGYSRSGISGVPFFIVNGEPAFSGEPCPMMQ